MPTVISPSEKKRLVDGAFRVGGIGLWGMKRGRAWRPTLPAAEWGEGVSAPCWASTPPGVWGMKRRRSALPRQGDVQLPAISRRVLVGPGLQEATVSVQDSSVNVAGGAFREALGYVPGTLL